jgi:murein DD-endopeptidase MepM/ murein hydrolase activator NlpD
VISLLRNLAIGIACFASINAYAKHASPEKLEKSNSSVQVKKAADGSPHAGKMTDADAAKKAAPKRTAVQTDNPAASQQADGADLTEQTGEEALILTAIDPDVEPGECVNEETDEKQPARRETSRDDYLISQIQNVLPELHAVEPGIYFSADPNNLDLLWPVETRTISSAWGPRVRRTSTVVKTPNGGKRRVYKTYNSVHKGIDLTAPLGHSIFAAMDGRVSSVGRERKLGNFVKIDHGNGVETVYGHNSANLVKAGDFVRRGQIIARVGNTGHSTGPHVHFEVRINNQQVNPGPWLNDTDEISAEILAHNEKFQLRGRSRQ